MGEWRYNSKHSELEHRQKRAVCLRCRPLQSLGKRPRYELGRKLVELKVRAGSAAEKTDLFLLKYSASKLSSFNALRSRCNGLPGTNILLCGQGCNLKRTQTIQGVITFLVLKHHVVSIYTNSFNVKNTYVLSKQCICVFCMGLKTNSCYFTIQR